MLVIDKKLPNLPFAVYVISLAGKYIVYNIDFTIFSRIIF